MRDPELLNTLKKNPGHMFAAADIDKIIGELKERRGIDFSFYQREAFIRRIERHCMLEKILNFEEFRERLFSDEENAHHFIDRITVGVTELFRDPDFFKALRDEVLPALADLPRIRIWHPGCSTGEEVLSMAILLQEADLLHKSELTGTDINPFVLQLAKELAVSVENLELFRQNYRVSGGKTSLDDFLVFKSGKTHFRKELRDKITYKLHNLACDRQFGQFDLIVCRNVMIYFSKKALQTTFHLLDDCSKPGSFLALGEKETIQLSAIAGKFKPTGKQRVWRKK